jgi:CRISPR-associated protein Csm4
MGNLFNSKGAGMMKLYRVKLRLQSSHITPWHSDTILGSLCWIIAQQEGENRLAEFLRHYQNGDIPFVVSNCFPGDLLPKPMAGNFIRLQELSKEEALEQADKAKQSKKTELVTLTEFNAIINNQLTDISSKKNMTMEIGVMHNQINRFSGTTTEGSLYEQHEIFWQQPYLSLYAGIEAGWEEKFLALMEKLSQKGYGKRVSVGKGIFKLDDFSLFNEVVTASKANAIVTLSNFVPKASDPVAGQYKTFVKYGKLGQTFATGENPFKKPLMMIKPGAVFWTDEPQMSYGRLVNGISDDFPEVVQFGYTLAIAAAIEKPVVNINESYLEA